MAEDLPDALAALVRGLEERGFVVTTDHTDKSAFGNRVIELRARTWRRRWAVRLVKDRGLWEVEIKLGPEWHGAYAVKLALHAAPYGTRAESHAERCATTLEVVDALATGQPRVRVLKRRLRDYQRAYGAGLGVGVDE